METPDYHASLLVRHRTCFKRVRIRARVDVIPPILQDSYVTAYYRGRWFWIEDTDLRSKQVFSFVIELLQLAQRTTAPSLPVVTIPSG